MEQEKYNEIYDMGTSIKKQIIYKSGGKQNIYHLIHLIGNHSNEDIILNYLMKMILGHNVSVNLRPLTDTIGTSNFETATKILGIGLVSK